MNLVQFFASLFFFLGTIDASITLEGDVLVLDDSNFSEAKTTHNLLLVEFYAPWCGHCKNLAPEWAKAATTLKDSPVKLAKVDATIATELAKLYSVTGFPTIKFFKNGNPSDYDGGRTEKDIVNWVNKKTGPPAVTITNEEELLKLQESNDVLALGVFDNLESDAAKSFYSYAGTTSIETVFVITSSPEIKASLGLTQDAIVVLKNFDEKRNDYPIEGTVVTSSLDEFIGKASTPLVQNFTQASSKKIFGSSVKKHALLFFNKESDNSELMKTFTSVATTYNGQLLFITIDESNGGVLSYFGFTADQLPKLVVADMTSSMKKYPLDGELNVESITAHIEGFKEGTLKPTLKSEEPSPADLEDPVKVLKGKSFQDIVMNNKKDVMVEIYAPWCGHCKKLAPIYEEVAEHFEDSPHIVITKMDGTMNEIDIEGFDVNGYPSLYFVPGDTKKPIAYSGGREKEDIIKFINEHAAKVYTPSTHEEL